VRTPCVVGVVSVVLSCSVYSSVLLRPRLPLSSPVIDVKLKSPTGAPGEGSFKKASPGDGKASIFNVKPTKMFGSGGKSTSQLAATQREKVEKFDGEKKATKSGEEDETKLHTVTQCKLYRFDSETKAWKHAGGGQVTLNQQKGDVEKSRLVLRQGSTKRVFLNAPVWAGMECKFESKGMRFAGVNHIDGSATDASVRVFLVQSTKDAKELRWVPVGPSGCQHASLLLAFPILPFVTRVCVCV